MNRRVPAMGILDRLPMGRLSPAVRSTIPRRSPHRGQARSGRTARNTRQTIQGVTRDGRSARELGRTTEVYPYETWCHRTVTE